MWVLPSILQSPYRLFLIEMGNSEKKQAIPESRKIENICRSFEKCVQIKKGERFVFCGLFIVS